MVSKAIKYKLIELTKLEKKVTGEINKQISLYCFLLFKGTKGYVALFSI